MNCDFWEIRDVRSTAIRCDCTKHRVRLILYRNAVLHPEHIVHLVHFVAFVLIHAMDVTLGKF